MSRKPFKPALKDRTNLPANARKLSFTDAERVLLKYHNHTERREMTLIPKYIKYVTEYYESIDIPFNYSSGSVSADEKALLLDWVIDCHERLFLLDDTLYFTFFLINRFLNNRKMLVEKLQLVGITALLIAAKYEEVVSPEIEKYIELCDNEYSKEDIKSAERFMLYSLNYKIDYVNPLFFLRRAAKSCNHDA